MFDRENYIPVVESCIIGALAGLSAVLLSAGVDWLGSLRVHLSDHWPSVYVLPAFGLVGGLIAGLLVDRVAPEASGSGIPQVRAALDRMVMPLNLRIALVKLLGGTIALGSGFFMGREGPTVQLGAALAAPLTRWLPTTAEHKRQLIAAGAGAGLTAAFNAPLAGVTFVLEELLREIKPTTVIVAAIACSVSCFVLNLFGPPHAHAISGVLSQAVPFVFADVPFYVLLGVLAGLSGAVFNAAIIGSLNVNRKALRIPVAIRIGLAGLVSGAVISALPDVFHDYAATRALIISGDIDWIMVAVAFVEFNLLTLVAYGSGAPGGLFAPALAIGSALGYLVGCFEHSVMGTGSTTAFALVGMGAFVSAVVRTPLTAIVITFELTSNFAILTPLMFACVISSAVGDLVFRGGLYDHLMRLSGIALRERASSESLRIQKVRDVMHRNIDVLSSESLVKGVLPTFDRAPHRGFPVVDRGKLVGVITQADLAKVSGAESMDCITVAEIMTLHPVAVGSDDSLEEILFLFNHHKFTWLPVTDRDVVQGVILQSDVLNALFPDSGTAKGSQIHGDTNTKTDVASGVDAAS